MGSGGGGERTPQSLREQVILKDCFPGVTSVCVTRVYNVRVSYLFMLVKEVSFDWFYSLMTFSDLGPPYPSEWGLLEV